MPRVASLIAAFVVLTPVASAQIVHAHGNDLVFADNWFVGVPNATFAIFTQMPAATVATKAEIWTGEAFGQNTIALWSHDPINNRPLAPLGSGSWQMTAVDGWQGAYLAPPVLLNAGQDVWIVWGTVDGCQSSIHNDCGNPNNPCTQNETYLTSLDGGQSWNGPFHFYDWKFRIWTGFPGHYQPFGAGCTGTHGVPQLGWFGMPLAGSSFDVHLDQAMPSTLAILSFGESNTNSGSTPLPYSLAPHGAPNCSVLGSLLVTLFAPTDASGSSVVTVTLPNDPSLAGFQFYDQWFCFDAAANALGLTVSNAGQATIGV